MYEYSCSMLSLCFTYEHKNRFKNLTKFRNSYITLLFINNFNLFIIIKLLKINSQTYLSPLSFGNTGNIGLPLAYFAFGEIGLGYAVLVLSITSILSFSIGIWFVSGETSFLKTLKNEPLLAATFFGINFSSYKISNTNFFHIYT